MKSNYKFGEIQTIVANTDNSVYNYNITIDVEGNVDPKKLAHDIHHEINKINERKIKSMGTNRIQGGLVG